MKIVPWTIAAFAMAIALMSIFRAPREIIREVPVEKIKEVINQVPVEVIKEVEKKVEVVKEVPIVKEVERRFTPKELQAIANQEAVDKAEVLAKSSDALRGIQRVSLSVRLDEVIGKRWSQQGIVDKISLELRRSGIEILSPDASDKVEASIVFRADGMTDANSNTPLTFYRVELLVRTPITSMLWDFKYHTWSSEIWSTGTMGYFGTAKADESQRNVLDQVVTKLASEILEANPIGSRKQP